MQAMTDTLIAQRVLVRDMPDRSRIVATLRISQYASNPHPHFSATAEIYDAQGRQSGRERARRGLEAESGGMQHDAILDAFPGAWPFVRMHLAEYPSGRPMHATDNAWYFLTAGAEKHEREHYGPAYAERQGSRITRARRALNVGELPWPFESELDSEHFPTRERFNEYVETLAPAWERQASQAVAVLEAMPDVTDLRGYDNGGEPIDRQPLPAWLIGADPETVDV